ncbi:hypothetical protein D3C87_1766520 [compost metagenome]
MYSVYDYLKIIPLQRPGIDIEISLLHSIVPCVHCNFALAQLVINGFGIHSRGGGIDLDASPEYGSARFVLHDADRNSV